MAIPALLTRMGGRPASLWAWVLAPDSILLHAAAAALGNTLPGLAQLLGLTPGTEGCGPL